MLADLAADATQLPAGTGVYDTRAAGQRRRLPRFQGADFIEGYLTPHEVGCAAHNQPECLCDVDTSKTADMTWDTCPQEFWNVETAEDLVMAAAHVWLWYDLLDHRVHQDLPFTSDPIKCQEVAWAIKAGKTQNWIKANIGPTLDNHTFALVRKALGWHRPSQINEDLLRQVHAEGHSIAGIRQRLIELQGRAFHKTSISKSLKRMGLKPNRTAGTLDLQKYPQGCPKGFKRGCGLTYRQWREQHGQA